MATRSRKGEIRQFPPFSVRRKQFAVDLQQTQDSRPFWEDGTPRSINNAFNWRNIQWKQKA
jgi:hypothetical protein